jgi:beta-phosphoglucomutase
MKAILFDLDGVLVDAKEWHHNAFNKALAVYGYHMSNEEHLKYYDGLSTKEKMVRMNIPFDLRDKIADLKRKYTEEVIKQKIKPDKVKQVMLKKLSRKFRLGCGSNAQKHSVVKMLKLAGIYKYFDEIIGNDEGFPNKPNPSIYLELMKRLSVKPKECLVVEDNKYGIEAGKKSGAIVIEVRRTKDVNIDLFKEYI